MPSDLQLLHINTNGLPLLTPQNWVEWNALLLDILAPYTDALNIMTGKVKQGSDHYNESLDRELTSLIHRHVSSPCRKTVRCATFKYGQKGSQVYKVLQDTYGQAQGWFGSSRVEKELGALQQNSGEILPSYIDRTWDLYFRASEDRLTLSECQKQYYFVSGLKDPKCKAEARHLQDEHPEWSWQVLAEMTCISS